MKFFFIFILTFNSFIISDAKAYLDPGSGSMIVQAILASLAAFFSTLYIYWNKFKNFFKNVILKFKKNNAKK